MISLQAGVAKQSIRRCFKTDTHTHARSHLLFVIWRVICDNKPRSGRGEGGAVYLPPVFTMETCSCAHLYAHARTHTQRHAHLHSHGCTHVHTNARADVHAHTFCGPKAFGCLATRERKFHLQKEDFTSSLTTPKITKPVQAHPATSTYTHTHADINTKNPGLTVL